MPEQVQRPERPPPTPPPIQANVYEDPRARRAAFRLIERCASGQPSIVLAMSDAFNLLMLDATAHGVFEGQNATDQFSSMLGRTLALMMRFRDDQAVVNFVGQIAKKTLLFRQTPLLLLGSEGGHA